MESRASSVVVLSFGLAFIAGQSASAQYRQSDYGGPVQPLERAQSYDRWSPRQEPLDPFEGRISRRLYDDMSESSDRRYTTGYRGTVEPSERTRYYDWVYRDLRSYDPWGMDFGSEGRSAVPRQRMSGEPDRPGRRRPDSREYSGRPDERRYGNRGFERSERQEFGERGQGIDRRRDVNRLGDRGFDANRLDRDGFRGRFGRDLRDSGFGPAQFDGRGTDDAAFRPRESGIGGFRAAEFGAFDNSRFDARRDFGREFDDPATIGDLGLDTEASRGFRNPGTGVTTDDFRRSWVDPAGLGGGGFGAAGLGFDEPGFNPTELGESSPFGGFGESTFGGGAFGRGFTTPGSPGLMGGGGLGGRGLNTPGTLGGAIGAPGPGID